MEGSIVSRVCRAVRRSCWPRTRRRRYQRLPATTTCSTASKRPAWRGVRLGRRRLPALSSTARRFERPRRRACCWERWSSPPPHLLITRLVDTCINSVLLRPLKAVTGFSPAAGMMLASEEGVSSSPPKLLRRGDSSRTPRRGKELGGGRGVTLNICVAEVLLRRSSSQVRSSPLQVARKAAGVAS